MFSSAYVWAKILGYMEEQLGSVIVSTWFDDAEVVELNEEQLILHTSSDYRRDIITQRYQSYIREALQEIFRSDAKLVVFGDKEYEAYKSKGKKTPAPQKQKKAPASNPATDGDGEEFDAEYIRNLDPRSKEYAEFRKKMGLR